MTEPLNGGAPPRVDPTTVTKEAIDTAKEDLRREAATNLSSLRIEVMSEIRRVNDVADQKFDAVNQRFAERDTRTEQGAQESRISLDAALAAAKEAVSEQNKANAQSILKSEVATQKQIDSLVTLSDTRIGAVEERLGDLKERQDKGQGGLNGERYEKTEHRAQSNLTTNIVTAAILGASAVVTVLIAKGK